MLGSFKITDPRPQEMLSAPAKACVLHDEHKVPHRLAECSYGLSPVCLSRLSRSPRLRDFLDWKTTVLVSPGLSEAEVSPKSNWKGRKSKLMDKLNAEVKMGVSPRRSRSINRWKSPRDDIGMNDIELFTPPRHPVMKPTGYRSTLRRGRPNTIRTGLPPPPSPQAKLEMTSESSPGRTLLHYTSDPGPISETKTSLIQVSSPLRISHPNAASSVRTLKLPNHCESTALDVQKVLTFEAEPEPDQQQVKGSRQLDHHHPSRECVEPQSSSMKNVDSGIFEMVSSDEFEVLDIDIKSRSLNASTGSIEKLANISRKLTLEESVAVKGKSVNPSTPSSPTSRGALPLTKGASLSATSVPLAADPRQPKVVEWRPASLVLTTDNASWSDENQTAVFRPSIARLMREKAGSVSAATKKFNALAEQSEQEFRGPPTPSINSLCWHSPTFITPVSGARKSIPCPLSNTQNESHFRKKTMTGSERKMNCKDFHTATIMTRECDPFSEKLLRPWSRDSVKENLPPTAHQRATRNKSTSSPTCHSSSDAKPRSQSSRTKATLNSPSFRPRHVAGVSRSKSARVASLATISPDLVVRRSPRLRYKKGHQKSMGGEQPRRLQTLPRRTTSI